MKTSICYLFIIVATIHIGCKSSPLSLGNTGTATIIIDIRAISYVSIKVENCYNTVVASMQDGLWAIGSYPIAFDESNLPEGIYIAFIEIKEIHSRKVSKSTQMLLLRR